MKYTAGILTVFFLYAGCIGTAREGTRWRIPAQAEVPGWRYLSEPRVYDRTNIVLYLKEHKDIYTEYGFRELTVAEFIRIDDDERRIRVELFEMNNGLNAFGIFSRERGFRKQPLHSPGADRKAGSAECFSGERFTSCYCGAYYWKIYLLKHSGTEAGDIRMFIDAIKRHIPNSPDPLPKCLPGDESNDRPGSVVYYPGYCETVPGLRNIFLSRISSHGREHTVFYTRRNNSAAALGEFMDLVNREKNGYILKKTGHYHSAFRMNKDGSHFYLGLFRDRLMGVVKTETLERGDEVMEKLVSFFEKCELNNK